MPETKKIRRSFVVDEKVYNLLPQTKIKNLSKLIELAIMSAVPYFFEDVIKQWLSKFEVSASDEEIRETFLKLFPYSQNIDSAIEKTVIFLVKKYNPKALKRDFDLKMKSYRARNVFKKAGLIPSPQ